MSTTAEKLTDHYDAASARSGQSLQERLREAFRDAGRDPERLSLAVNPRLFIQTKQVKKILIL